MSEKQNTYINYTKTHSPKQTQLDNGINNINITEEYIYNNNV